MKTALALTASLTFAGCHHAPTVIQTGPDTYLAGVTSHSGFKNDMDVTSAAMDRANAFCQRQSKVAEMMSSMSKGHQLLTAQSAQIQFRCVDRAPPQAASSPT